jgi:hypothetical protein
MVPLQRVASVHKVVACDRVEWMTRLDIEHPCMHDRSDTDASLPEPCPTPGAEPHRHAEPSSARARMHAIQPLSNATMRMWPSAYTPNRTTTCTHEQWLGGARGDESMHAESVMRTQKSVHICAAMLVRGVSFAMIVIAS